MNLSMCLGWSWRGIAERMGVGVKAVAKQRTRGLTLLREWFLAKGGGMEWRVSYFEDGGGSRGS
jgi:hypothetical protein